MQVPLTYYSVKNLTDPGQKELGITQHLGKARVQDIVHFSTHKNLRGYIAALDDKKRTKVHLAIENTLREQPNLFSTYNAGINVCAFGATGFSSGQGTLYLEDAYLMNGAQTQGSIQKTLEEPKEGEEIEESEDACEAFVLFNLVIIPREEEEIAAQMTISLNNQNAMKMLSMVNAEKALQDIDKAFRRQKMKIRLRESDPTDNGLVDTERLLQVIEALTPLELWDTFWNRRCEKGIKQQPVMVKTPSYGTKTRVLSDFKELFEAATNPDAPKHTEAKALYQYYVDIGPAAWKAYLGWKTHQYWDAQNLKGPQNKTTKRFVSPVKKDEHGVVIDVVDGLVFPCLAAMAKFVVKIGKAWTLKEMPDHLKDVIIDAVGSYYKGRGRSTAHTCGRTMQCYVLAFNHLSIALGAAS